VEDAAAHGQEGHHLLGGRAQGQQQAGESARAARVAAAGPVQVVGAQLQRQPRQQAEAHGGAEQRSAGAVARGEPAAQRHDRREGARRVTRLARLARAGRGCERHDRQREAGRPAPTNSLDLHASFSSRRRTRRPGPKSQLKTRRSPKIVKAT
jgi:hypothetical protein